MDGSMEGALRTVELMLSLRKHNDDSNEIYLWILYSISANKAFLLIDPLYPTQWTFNTEKQKF